MAAEVAIKSHVSIAPVAVSNRMESGAKLYTDLVLERIESMRCFGI